MKVLIEQATIDQAEGDFRGQRQALLDRGQAVPAGTATSTYADKIRAIASPWALWAPNPTWFDIGAVNGADESGYAYRVIQLLTDANRTTDLGGATAYRTSDGGFYMGNATHTWDVSKDLPSSMGYKTRWVTHYHTEETIVLSFLQAECLYFVVDRCKITAADIGGKRMLQSFQLVNGANFQSISNFGGMFESCGSLAYVPSIETGSGTNFAAMFESCYALQYHEPLNTENGLNFDRMYYSTRSLTSISSFDTSRGTSIADSFTGGYALNYINNFTQISTAIKVSDCHLNRDTLLRLLAALVDLTGKATQTLTLGSRNRSKLVSAELAVATGKNWTIA